MISLRSRAAPSLVAGAPDALAQAIARTIAYADVFDYALGPDEIQRRLIGLRASPGEVRAALHGSAWLDARIEQVGGWHVLRGRAACVEARARRAASSARLLADARPWLARIAGVPFVRMVALTGALAAANAEPGDDIDLLIVTAPGRVWLTRALVIGLVRLARRRAVRLCPNYVLSERVLAQQRRDVYVAHDLAAMQAVFGNAVAARMRIANAWVREHLPNAEPAAAGPELRPDARALLLKRALERVLGGALGGFLERAEHRRKARKLAALQRPGSAALLDDDHVKGHFDDHRGPVLSAFHARLAGLGLEARA